MSPVLVRLVAFWAVAFGVSAALWSAGVLQSADPSSWTRDGAPWIGLAGLLLLLADVVLVVPSSLVMAAMGAALGAPLGTLVATLGGVGAAAIGWAIGRVGASAPSAREEGWLRRWGPAILVLTRPIPMLAESMVVVAGATGLPLRTTLAWSALGCLPTSAMYATLGAAAEGVALPSLVVWVSILGLAGVAWVSGRVVPHHLEPSDVPPR